MAGNSVSSATGVTVARINVKVLPDTKEFRRVLKAELEEIERTMKGDVHIKAHLDSAQARADFERLKNAMQNGRVKLGVDLDVDRGKRGGKGGVDLPEADGFEIPIPRFGTGINPAGWAVILTGIAAAAGPLVGLITSALLTLPGLITTLLAPIGAVTLGLDGFKKAAEAIKPQFEELKATMSEAAQTSFTPVLERLANEVFPKLRDSLPGVTEGLAEMSSGILDSLKGAAGQQLQDSIARIGDMFTAMRPGMASMTSGFTGLIDQFTMKLPAVSEWFNKSMEGFNKWVAEVSADGTLSNAFDGLGATVEKIMSTIADLGKKGIEFMGDPQNIQMIDDLLDGVHGTLVGIMEVSEKIAGAWDTIKSLLTGGNMLAKLTQGDLLGAWDAFKESELGQRNDYVGNGASGVQDNKARADDLKKSINEAAEAADKGAPKVQEFLGGGVDNLPAADKGPDSGATAKQVQETAVEAVKVEIPAPDLSQFQAGLSQIPSMVANAFQAAVTAGSGGVQALATLFSAAVEAIVTALNGGTQAILTIVNSWPPMIQAALSSLNAVGNAAGMQLCAGMAAGIQAGSGNVIAVATALATQVRAAVEGALDINSPSRVFHQIGLYTTQGMAQGLEDGIGPVTDQARALAGKVARAFAEGSDPTVALKGISSKDVNRMEKLLGFESKGYARRARALDYQAKVTGDQSFKAEADRLRMLKEEVDAHKEMLDLANEYNGVSSSSGEDPFVKAASGLMSAPYDFAAATGKQFLSDIGINGDGMIGNAITEGIKYVFNIGSVDEALSIKDRTDAKQALSIVGR